MAPDPTRTADTKAWLTKVVHGLRRGDILLGVEHPDVEGALFHCQQAAEKAFKAFLTWHDVPFRRLHELDVIGGHCIDVDPALKDICGSGRHSHKVRMAISLSGCAVRAGPGGGPASVRFGARSR